MQASVRDPVGTPHDEAFTVIRDRHRDAARGQYGYGQPAAQSHPTPLLLPRQPQVQRKRNVHRIGE